MKPLAVVVAALAGATFALAAETAKIELTVSGVPAGASQLVVIFDAGAPPPQDYQDANAAAAVVPPPPAAAAAAAPAIGDAPAAGQQRRRRGGGRGGEAAALPAPTRITEAVNGRTTATLTANVPAGDNYQARVVAFHGDGTFPTVLAGGRVAPLKLVANATMPLKVALKAPEVRLAPNMPPSVARGARYTLAGTLTEAAHALGAKNRMRVWISEGAPPAANYAGTQTSTVDVTTNGDDVVFSFDLVAPNRATTLYFQFGEVPPDFARADGSQAAFVVVPDLGAGAKPLALKVE